MAKFHINRKGEAGKCGAVKGSCPFGGEIDHFTSPEAARAAYEKNQAESTDEFSRVEKAIKDYGETSSVFRSWGAVHSDFKVSTDGNKRVMVNAGGAGVALVPWLGPKPLERHAAMAKKIETLERQQELAANPPSSFAGYSPAFNAMELDKVRIGERYYDSEGTAYIVEETVKGSFASMNPLDEKGNPLGTPGRGVIRVGEGRNAPDKFFKLTKLSSGTYVDGQAGFSESKAIKELPASGHFDKAVSGVVNYVDDEGRQQTLELLAPVARLTDRKRLELGRQLWALTGKDPQRYEDVSDEEKLHWANQRIMRRADFSWTNTEGYISFQHKNGAGARYDTAMKLVDLD